MHTTGLNAGNNGNSACASLAISTPDNAPANFTLKVRIPAWTSQANINVAVNGEPWVDEGFYSADESAGRGPTGPFAGHSNASFYTIRREWGAGGHSRLCFNPGSRVASIMYQDEDFVASALDSLESAVVADMGTVYHCISSFLF